MHNRFARLSFLMTIGLPSEFENEALELLPLYVINCFFSLSSFVFDVSLSIILPHALRLTFPQSMKYQGFHLQCFDSIIENRLGLFRSFRCLTFSFYSGCCRRPKRRSRDFCGLFHLGQSFICRDRHTVIAISIGLMITMAVAQGMNFKLACLIAVDLTFFGSDENRRVVPS